MFADRVDFYDFYECSYCHKNFDKLGSKFRHIQDEHRDEIEKERQESGKLGALPNPFDTAQPDGHA